MQVTLRVNGTVHRTAVAPDDSLLTALRDSLDLTGTKYGCGEGQCGAWMVLVDGQAVKACQSKASLFQSRAITTIEGLAQDGRLHPVQEAFLQHDLKAHLETPERGMTSPASVPARADVTVDAHYTVAYIAHAPLEPRAGAVRVTSQM